MRRSLMGNAFVLAFLASLPLAYLLNVWDGGVQQLFDNGIYSYIGAGVYGGPLLILILLLISSLLAWVLGWVLGLVIRGKWALVVFPLVFLVCLLAMDRSAREQQGRLFFVNMVEAECKKIAKVYIQKYCTRVVHEVHSTADCDGNKFGDKASCLTRVAAELHNPAICQSLEQSNQDECYERVAKAAADASICKSVRHDSDSCYRGVASLYRASSVCSRVTDANKKYYCQGFTCVLDVESWSYIGGGPCKQLELLPRCGTEAAKHSYGCEEPQPPKSHFKQVVDSI